MIGNTAAPTTERNGADGQGDLRRVEAELERRTAELEQMRTALAQLASTVSHDLSQPLTTITGFADLLARRYEGRLDSDAEEFIGFILKGAGRLRKMIDDLVSYLRAAQNEPPHSPVDCSRMVQTVVDSLATPIAESEATLIAEPLPAVRGDAVQLGQVFGHLISNALKFANGQPPRITITADRTPDATRFSVADNGVGVGTAHAERVFELFQRFEDPDSNPGTGVGLAICKKIVERHGGRIWVEPGPEGGSIFRFTIPNAVSVAA